MALLGSLGLIAAAEMQHPVHSKPVTQPAGQQTQQQPVNYVLLNGSIYTVNPKQPWAQAVAVRGDQIVYVGNNQGARAYIGTPEKVRSTAAQLVSAIKPQ